MTGPEVFLIVILSAATGYILAQLEMCIRELRQIKPQARAAEEFVTVPVEPTSAMLKAACASMSPGKRPTDKWVPVKEKHRIRYRAMIQAAPRITDPVGTGSKT